MGIINNRISNVDGDKKYYWSPSVGWEKIGNEIRIEIVVYPAIFADLFPEFYYMLRKGATKIEILNEFSKIDSRKLNGFISNLITNKILVSSILTPAEIFYPQTKMFRNEFSEKIFYDQQEYKNFKKKQLTRSCYFQNNTTVKLEDNLEFPEFILRRRTYRSFNECVKMPFNVFSKLLSVFGQKKENDSIRYLYASAGGLYPIDVYVYVKENRIENVKQGLYYYNPMDNSLKLVDDVNGVTEDCHYYINKNIFKSSAFSIFLIYNAGANMPKYGGMGYFYACIDAGIMVGTLTQVAELNDVGLCSIGDMDYKKIKRFFNLNENQIFFHDIECGLKPCETNEEQNEIL